MGITTRYILDERRALGDGKFPVKLILTIDRQHRKYSIQDYKGASISLDKVRFEKIKHGKRLSEADKELRSTLNECIESSDQLVSNIIRNNPPITFDKFSDLYKNKVRPSSSVKDVFEKVISRLIREERIGTATSYKTAMNTLNKFRNSEGLGIHSITPDFLKSFEYFLKKDISLSNNSIGVYMRSLKVIVNQAIADSLMDQNGYPFGKGKYQIPKESTRKRSLTKEDMIKLVNYVAIKGSPHFFAKNYFLFSFFCNGMNFADLVELRKNSIEGDWLKYYRRKTTNTAHDKKLIQIFIDDRIKSLIQALKSERGRYLFPILNENSTEEEKRKERQQFIKTTNKWLKKIAKELDLSIKDISTYYARHSWATLQKRSGKSTEVISDSLGHNSIKTTQIYLDSFDEDSLKSLNSDLLK